MVVVGPGQPPHQADRVTRLFAAENAQKRACVSDVTIAAAPDASAVEVRPAWYVSIVA